MAAAKRGGHSRRAPFWRDVVARFEASELTVRAFCQQAGVCPSSLYAWRRALQPKAERPAFVPLVLNDVLPQAPGGELSVAWPGGRVLRVPAATAATRVAELVHAIEASPGSSGTGS